MSSPAIVSIGATSPSELPPYIANGVVGLRPDSTALNGFCTVNGYAGADPEEGVESWLYAPYPLAVEVEVKGWRGEIALESQHLDFATGELITTLRAGPVRLSLTQFCPRSLPFGAASRIEISVERPVQARIKLGFDDRRAHANRLQAAPAQFGAHLIGDGWFLWKTPCGRSRLGGAFATQCHGASVSPGPLTETAVTYELDLTPAQPIVLEHLVALVPSVMHGEPEREALRLLHLMKGRGLAGLRAENSAAWRELWRGRPILHGAETRWQNIADACFSTLHASAHASSPCSTGLFGLGQWPGYHCFRGHVFWDIETFTFPPLLLSAPHAASALLDYRFRHLEAARRNARLNGYRGVQFPWESGPLSGEEVTPSAWPKIIYEQHISIDVAFAFAQYVHATGDLCFARQRAWPVLSGVAQWIESRVTKTERGFEIPMSMGICENEPTNNNAFVLLAAGCVLREASALAGRLGFAAPPAWKQIAEALAVPCEGDLILRCDGYDPQAMGDCSETLAAFYPYTTRLDETTTRTTLSHFLDVGRNALGMPMLPPLFCVHAARLSDRELCLEMLERGVADYIVPPFLQFDEFGLTKTQNKPRVGPYLAHAGAFVMNLLLGLPGLQLRSEVEEWPQFPVVLPVGWEAIEVERLWAHERPLRLLARHGEDRARLAFED